MFFVTDTKHVPCKFFRQGACQAGPACPFLHSTDAAIEYAPCKYFTKVHAPSPFPEAPLPLPVGSLTLLASAMTG